jgi:hypothetical protein
MKSKSYDLEPMLEELRDAQIYAQQTASELSLQIRQIRLLLSSSMAVLSNPRVSAAVVAAREAMLEEAVRSANAAQVVAAALTQCANSAATLEPFVREAQRDLSSPKAEQAAKRLRDFAESFGALCRSSRVATRANEGVLASLRLATMEAA